jgi:hypothetical protein
MNRYLWAISVIIFSLISLAGDFINVRFDLVDFEVYFRTAERMIEGTAIYRIESDGHFVYKYAPSAALYFIPFVCLGFGLSKWVYWLILTALLVWALAAMSELSWAKKSNKSINIILIFSVLSVIPHIHLDWHLGQVNLLLMALYVLIIKAFLEDRQKLLGAILGISIFIKPFGLIFLPYLFIKKRFSSVFYTLLWSLIIGFLPFIFYPSWEQFTGLYDGWINELLIEMSGKQDLMADGNHTIFSVLARYTPLQYLLNSPFSQKLYQILVLGIMAVGFLKYMKKGEFIPCSFTSEFALLCSWIPLLAFSSQNAYLFTLPLIVYLMFHFDKLNLPVKLLFILGCFLIGINMHDLVGPEMHKLMLKHSIYVFGSLAITTSAFYLRLVRPKG